MAKRARNIDDRQVGDTVLTRNQDDPDAPLEEHSVTATSVKGYDPLPKSPTGNGPLFRGDERKTIAINDSRGPPSSNGLQVLRRRGDSLGGTPKGDVSSYCGRPLFGVGSDLWQDRHEWRPPGKYTT